MSPNSGESRAPGWETARVLFLIVLSSVRLTQEQIAGGQGIEATGNDFLLESLTVANTSGKAVEVRGAKNVTFSGFPRGMEIPLRIVDTI